MKDKIVVKRSAIHGRGVFAKRRLRRNMLVGAYEGERTDKNDTYVLWYEDEDGTMVGIDGRNELRFLNHARDANAIFWGNQLFVLRTIEPGTEITFDYGDEWSDIA